MSAVLGIVKTHDAAVRVESAPGEGTAVTVAFPLSGGAPEGAATRDEHDDEWAGEGAVLVIDDVPEVRTAAAAVLASVGFEPLTAPDGEQGLQLFDAHRGDIVAVLVDATMPGLSGRGTLSELVARGCQVPVILTSGHTDESFADIESMAAFLPKPFDYDALVDCLKNVLI